MPRFETAKTTKVEPVAGRFKIFHEHVEAVRSGAITVEAFYEFLHEQYTVLMGLRGEIEELCSEDYAAKSPDEISQGVQGMDSTEQGVQELSMYCEDGNAEHLEIGLDLIRRGTDLINDAKRINRASRDKLEEEWGFMY